MTRDEIKSMAAKSEIAMYAIGLKYDGLDATEGFLNRLEAFAKLVAQHEREACAKLCEEMRTYVDRNNAVTQASANECANAIRAR